MRHRHLNHEEYTPAAIDDVIERGGREDWVGLRRAAAADPAVMARILHVATARAAEPSAQRYHLWKHYAERHLA